ncbi:CvpA family protein [Staphylococcus devriesei]|uniref:CvpA family protein n=1 Tax=Staphylococcus devriesei TaxID=586733 RepID=UPI000E687DD8|nr:CvpA family protein [Staphylococcus devriesei]RIL71305.1 CvpA family protein [Staphylococcus devriesei]
MIIDLIVLLIIVYYLIIGFRRGAWLNSLHFLSSVAAIVIAHQFYRAIAKQLIVFVPFPKTIAFDTTYAYHFNELQQRFDSVIAFLLITVVCKLLLYLIVVSFDNIMTYQRLSLLSRIFGSVISVIMAMLMIQLIIYVVALYPIEWLQQSLKHSYLGSFILFNTPFFSSYVLNL